MLQVHSLQLQNESYRYISILKLEKGAYSAEEWIIILSYGIGRDNGVPSHLQLKVENLSLQRLHDSFLDGLQKVQCEQMRGEIWKLICKVHSSKSQYSSDVYHKFLKEVHPQLDNKIQKDIHRTIPGNLEFSQKAASGENRLYNVLKAYTSYDPEIGYC